MILIATIIGAMMTLITYGAFIIVLSFMAWMVVDAGKQDRFWWVVIILGVPFIGGVVYYFTEKKHEYAKAESHHIHESETEAQHEVSHPHHEHHRKSDVEQAVILADESHESKSEGKNESKKEDKKEDTKEVKVTEIT